jgi:hypothetical protein
MSLEYHIVALNAILVAFSSALKILHGQAEVSLKHPYS